MSLAIVEVLATLDPPHRAAKQYQGIANTFVSVSHFWCDRVEMFRMNEMTMQVQYFQAARGTAVFLKSGSAVSLHDVSKKDLNLVLWTN